MKIKIEHETEAQDYPFIGIAKDDDEVVLFWKHGEGVVMDAGSGRKEIGFACNGWMMSDFKPFHGKITIEQ